VGLGNPIAMKSRQPAQGKYDLFGGAELGRFALLKWQWRNLDEGKSLQPRHLAAKTRQIQQASARLRIKFNN
jgi:hypothetical protein